MKVSAQQLAELYGVDRRTVTNWVNSAPPCPSDMRGRVREFDTVAVARWREQQAARKAVEQQVPLKPVDLEEARCRYETARAELEELKLAQLRRQLLHVDDVSKELDRILQGLRAFLLSLPAAWADRLGACLSTAERQLMLADCVAEAMPLLEAATDDDQRAAA